jgi:hypothetical protein
MLFSDTSICTLQIKNLRVRVVGLPKPVKVRRGSSTLQPCSWAKSLLLSDSASWGTQCMVFLRKRQIKPNSEWQLKSPTSERMRQALCFLCQAGSPLVSPAQQNICSLHLLWFKSRECYQGRQTLPTVDLWHSCTTFLFPKSLSSV